MRRVIALAALLAVLLVPLSVTATDKVVNDEVVDMNDYYSDPFILVSNGQQIKVDITSNASIDVYIVSSSQMMNYPETFSPQYKVLNTKSAKFTWKQPDDQGYYTMIIDNEVNGNISGSANPVGPIKFSMTRSDPFTENVQGVVTAVSLFCIGIILVGVIIVVVIIVIIVMLLKKKKEPAAPPAQPYQQQPYQQPPPQQPYPQQPYQQPPQQQGPPGYQPPPPPPGSMPPR